MVQVIYLMGFATYPMFVFADNLKVEAFPFYFYGIIGIILIIYVYFSSRNLESKSYTDTLLSIKLGPESSKADPLIFLCCLGSLSTNPLDTFLLSFFARKTYGVFGSSFSFPPACLIFEVFLGHFGNNVLNLLNCFCQSNTNARLLTLSSAWLSFAMINS